MTLLLLMTSGDDSPRTLDCHAVGAGPWQSLCAAHALAVAFFAAGGYDEVVATRVNDARNVTATLAAAVAGMANLCHLHLCVNTSAASGSISCRRGQPGHSLWCRTAVSISAGAPDA